MSIQIPTSWSLREIVEVGSKAALGVAATCFAVGLLIVNTRLAAYGVYSSDFIRTEYVLAGAAFIVLVITGGFGFVFCVASIKGYLLLWDQDGWFRSGRRIALIAAIGVW